MAAKVIKATLDHIKQISPFIREADKKEVFASSGLEIEKALEQSISVDGYHYAGFIDEKLICIFGIGRIGNIGVPYLIGTDEIEKHKRVVAIHSKGFIDKYKREFDYMVNFVDARNKLAIKWLEWLGFTIHEAQNFGFLNLPFHKFDMEIK